MLTFMKHLEYRYIDKIIIMFVYIYICNWTTAKTAHDSVILLNQSNTLNTRGVGMTIDASKTKVMPSLVDPIN